VANQFPRGFKTKAENTAIEIRKQLGLDPHAPLGALSLNLYLNSPVVM
jgi:hypothetical protein